MRFAPHTALPRVKGVHQPRDSAVFFLKTNSHSGRCGAAGNKGHALISTTPPLDYGQVRLVHVQRRRSVTMDLQWDLQLGRRRYCFAALSLLESSWPCLGGNGSVRQAS